MPVKYSVVIRPSLCTSKGLSSRLRRLDKPLVLEIIPQWGYQLLIDIILLWQMKVQAVMIQKYNTWIPLMSILAIQLEQKA